MPELFSNQDLVFADFYQNIYIYNYITESRFYETSKEESAICDQPRERNVHLVPGASRSDYTPAEESAGRVSRNFHRGIQSHKKFYAQVLLHRTRL